MNKEKYTNLGLNVGRIQNKFFLLNRLYLSALKAHFQFQD